MIIQRQQFNSTCIFAGIKGHLCYQAYANMITSGGFFSMSKDFSAALKHRRSHYAISKDPVISDERIQEIVNEAVKYTPSSFNSQSARVVVLLGEQHD